VQNAIRLRPDNFTPPSRTPWGGTRLLARYKQGLGIAGVAADAPVGESWELSVSEEFHSLTEGGERLAEVLARAPEAALGGEATLGRATTALLVKWLDAGDNLSVQIHPEDDYAGLASGEGGKLEGWYVVAHEPGAGLYLGFRAGVSERDLVRAVDERADVSALMQFVPVQCGDFVLLEPGTPHAVGAGVTLIEPQLVAPGRRGVTYRYWDWNRRYAADGAPDPGGKPRELHLVHALAVTRWDRVTDPAWLASRRSALGWPDAHARARTDVICGPAAPALLRSTALHVARLCGTGVAQLPDWNALRALTVIEGEIVLGEGRDAITIAQGCSAAIPAAAGALAAELRQAHAVLAAVAV